VPLDADENKEEKKEYVLPTLADEKIVKNSS